MSYWRNQPNTACAVGGFHTSYGSGGDGFAVIQRCSVANTSYHSQLERLTAIASHEIAEAASDTGHGWALVESANTPPWNASVWIKDENGDSVENGDLCVGSRVYESGWIYGRTVAGGKLREILRNRRVVFEIDEQNQLFEWRSVVVRGPLYLIEPGTTAANATIHAKAVSLIRRLLPSALTDSDPVPFRDQLFRIRVAEISGRDSPSQSRALAGA